MDLASLKTRQQLKQIIVEELGYSATEDHPFPLHVSDEIKGRISSASVIASHKGFEIIFVQFHSSSEGEHSEKFDIRMRGIERAAISKMDKHLLQQRLFVFASDNGDYWHFINARSGGSTVEIRRFSITPFNRKKLRTATDQLMLTKIEHNDDLQSVIEKHRKAFDIEEVTMEFFRIFADKFLQIIEVIKESHAYDGNQKRISDIAQIILNRLVFLKFIEQKRWLDNNPDYLYDKFQPYFSSDQSYWSDVLLPLFALLSDKERKEHTELGEIPFLNGGLFGKEPRNLGKISIPNDFFREIFDDLLNRFNFTIEESSPSSVEVAVDPEMLGRIFEELVLRLEKTVNKSESEFKRELRRETGSYYTPRVAVYYMCREAISRRLATISGVDVTKVKKLIDLALDELPDTDQIKEAGLNTSQCQSLLHAIEWFSICDPAAGSGAFLLGALQILVGMKRFLKTVLGDGDIVDPNFNYTLKEEAIRRNIVGVDILQQAVHICELRLWLSLAVDYHRESEEPIPTLPNLTYKVYRGDSIVDHLAGHPLEGFRYFKDFQVNENILKRLNKIINLKESYFNETDEERKKTVRQSISKERVALTIDILKHELPSTITQTDLFGQKREINHAATQDLLKRLKKQAASSTEYTSDNLSFVWLVDLVEYFADHGHGGFDVVIGNPPYGVKNDVMKKGRERYGLGNDDSYGVFMTMAVQDLLKTGGVLSFITSDTWQTIKTHKPLRRFILDNSLIHHLVMMPTWLFGATVNTSILIATKSQKGTPIFGSANEYSNSKERRNNELIACDFTRAEKYTGELEENLYSLDNPEYVSTTKKAGYHYHQGLIETNSNWPFFVGSPKLFALMNDTTCKTAEKEIGEKEKKKIKVRQIIMNDNTIELVRFGDIAEVRQGLATGDNDNYLFQNPNARGNYRSIVDFQEYLLTDDDLMKITGDENIRIKVTEKGIHKLKTDKSFDSDLWFGGRYIVPHDKGGEGDTNVGFLPNYFVPIDYFIDWSQQSVQKLKSFTIHERDGAGSYALAAVIRNSDYYFLNGLTLSHTGMYSPMYRINNPGPFNVGGSCIFTNFDLDQSLGELCSKLAKYFFKISINGTVNASEDPIKEIPFCIKLQEKVISLVKKIIEKQKTNPRYDYMSNEQKEIDKLVYEMYGLNKDDIREVETWYARRYPKLARFCDIS